MENRENVPKEPANWQPKEERWDPLKENSTDPETYQHGLDELNKETDALTGDERRLFDIDLKCRRDLRNLKEQKEKGEITDEELRDRSLKIVEAMKDEENDLFQSLPKDKYDRIIEMSSNTSMAEERRDFFRENPVENK